MKTLDIDIASLAAEELVPALGAVDARRAKILGRLTSTPVPLPPPVLARGVPALTVRQVAARLHVSHASVRRMVADGRLAHFKIGTRNIRIPESAVAKVERGLA